MKYFKKINYNVLVPSLFTITFSYIVVRVIKMIIFNITLFSSTLLTNLIQ